MLNVEDLRTTEADHLKQSFRSVLAETAQQVGETLNLQELQQIAPIVPHLIETATYFESWLSDDNLTWTAIAILQFYKAQADYSQATQRANHCLHQTKNDLVQLT